MTKRKLKLSNTSMKKWGGFSVVCLLVLLLAFSSRMVSSMIDNFTSISLPAIEPTLIQEDAAPDFAAFTNTKEKKIAFFDYIHPFVLMENERLRKLRHAIKKLKDKSKHSTLSAWETEWLQEISSYYKLKLSKELAFEFDQLLLKVDIVPPSLALAQAAIESAWGTSRFAKQANNYYGHWCYRPGCGLVPKYRSKEARHEVRKFKSAHESTIEYMKNLNTQTAYHDFRKTRAVERASHEDKLSGTLLSQTLVNYSQEREHYLRKLSSMIKNNKLADLDQLPFTKLE